MQAGAFPLSLPTWEQMMIDLLTDLWDALFGREKKEPEGVIRMKTAITELQDSTEELRQKLNEHRHEYMIVGVDPIRDHVVPREYTRQR